MCDITLLVSFHSKFPVIGTTHFLIQNILIYLMIDWKKERREKNEVSQCSISVTR